MADDDILVEARGVTKHFPVQSTFLGRLLSRSTQVVHAVDDVDLRVRRGHIHGLVGESGCGKTTLGRLLLRLLEPTAGEVLYDGRALTDLSEGEVRPLRRQMQLIFQDPAASLNPAMTVGNAVMDPLLVHGLASRDEARKRAIAMLREVGLSPPEEFVDELPADLSGGERQRVVIARAMITEPDFVVCDEPVSMLDMSIRSKILELLLDLRERYGLTLLFITHDLATAKFLCDEMSIMYLGEVVEEGDAREIYEDPKHPYTRSLLDAIPVPDPSKRREHPLPRGEVPDAVQPPSGCRFHPRCPVARSDCGWDGNDLVQTQEARLLELPPKERESLEALLGDPDAWDVGTARVRIPVDAGREGEAAHLLRELAAHRGEALAGALQGVEPGDGEVVATLRDPQPVEGRWSGGRWVRCVLYDDERDPTSG